MRITKDRRLILTACTAAMKAANNHADPFGAEAKACVLESLQLSREWQRELDADLAVTP